MRIRPGFSLLELSLTLTIGGILLTIAVTAFTSAQRITRLQRERVALAEAHRVTATVLAAELRYLEPATDLYALEEDSLAIRAFRGTAVVCASSEGMALVRYRGLRAPEPAKDSLVLVHGRIGKNRTAGAGPGGPPEGGMALALLTSSTATTGCPLRDDESLYRWSVDSPLATGTLLLLFESGSYHLNGSAFRYRRGESGRQPLTSELFDDRAIGLSWIDAGGDYEDDGEGGSANGDGPDRWGDDSRTRAGIELILAPKPPGAGASLAAPTATRYWIGLRR